MKKAFVVILFSLTFLLAKAQVDDNYFLHDNYKAVAGIDLNYELSSNSLSTKFQNTYLFGSHIDSLSKQWLYANLKPDNRLGADIGGGLSFITYPDTLFGWTNMGLFVKYNRYYHLDMTFTRDLARLFFDGNQYFAGKNAILDNSMLNLVSYDQIQIGILSKFESGKFKHTYGFGISLNNGYNNVIVDLNKGNIYTDKNAEYINFAANYDVSRSDTSRKKLNMFKGVGSSVNLYYSFETPKKNTLVFQLTDLGYIRWNNNSQQFSKDTAVHFEGLDVTDPLNINGNVFGKTTTDSLQHAFTYAGKPKAYYTATPAVLSVSYLCNFSEKFRTELSLRKKFFSNYDPLYMLKLQLLPNKKNLLSLNLSYGGYCSTDLLENHQLNAGLELMHQFGKSLVVLLGSNYLNGFIWPYSLTSQGVFFSIKKYFF